MGIGGRLAFSLVMVCGTAALAAAGDGQAAAAPRVGEVHAIAIAPGNETAVATLHRDGWLQANGALLRASQFPALYSAIGRTWTQPGVREGRFAVPNLHDTLQQPLSGDNPFGVLGPGDLVRGDQAPAAAARRVPLSYWIFVGQDLSGAAAPGVSRR
jgi:hypothetical protein